MNAFTEPFPACRSAGGLVFVGGQIALDPSSQPTPSGLRPVAPDCLTQAQACIDRIQHILAQNGATLNDVLRIECFLSHAGDLPAWHAVFMERFAPPRPTRTTVIAAPPVPGFLIELQAVALAGRPS
ncbi:RidA family protein [Steroidobacter sp.]|uniref:RidA family protein n=1 Tax=Steroidobacter sp. TaxID=1978227 RepID=UPI001A527E47|nr:RidA family protein [Steroidobacter sp.]MBL8268333.1 RidA family protein [Steroidobacter sp.]